MWHFCGNIYLIPSFGIADKKSVLAWQTKETDPGRLQDRVCSFRGSTPTGVMHAK